MSHRRLLKDNFFVLLGCFQFVGALSLFIPTLFWLYLLSWPVLIALTFLEWKYLPRTDELELQLEGPEIVEINQSAQVAVEVRGLSLALGSNAQIYFTEQRCLRPLSDRLRLQYDSKENKGKGSVSFRSIRLGYEQVQNMELRVDSPLGFWSQKTKLGPSDFSIKVVPTKKIISEQEFLRKVRQPELAQLGIRRRMLTRSAGQLHSVREYRFPDPLRDVDQKKSAKLRKLMTREYEDYFDHQAVIALDLGRHMRGEVLGSKKLDYYVAAAASLAENAIHSNDRVGFFAFSQKVHRNLRAGHKTQEFRSLYLQSKGLEAFEEESNYDLLGPATRMNAPGRSLLLILTDSSKASVQAELLRVLPQLSRRHLCFILSMNDPAWSVSDRLIHCEPRRLSTDEFREIFYGMALEQASYDFQRLVRNAGASLVRASHDNWIGIINRLYSMARLSTRLG